MELAESISGTLGLATLGSLSVLIGLVLVVFNWVSAKKTLSD